MALKLVKETSEGFSAEYWRVSPDIAYNIVDQTIVSKVLLYVNQAQRVAGKRSVGTHDVSTAPDTAYLAGPVAVTAIQTGDPRGALYTALKALTFFAGAEDC